MTLSKRLIIVISVLFLFVFCGTLGINITNTRYYLTQQLKINSQDTATSLGKSISQSLVDNDLEKLKSIINGTYEPGFYTRIEVKASDDRTIYKREMQNLQVQDVPTWFVKLIALQVPDGIQEIIDNSFRRIGQVAVSAYPGLAYQNLWQHFKTYLLWLALTGLLTFCATFFLIRMIMRPIAALEAQAQEIAEGHFVIQQTLPNTPELASVAASMNKMSSKVAQMLTAQTQLTEDMRNRAYQDSLTGLKNRRFFAEQMDHLIKTPEEFVSGSLMLIEVSEFKQYNQRYGYVQADELLIKIGQAIKTASKNVAAIYLARVSGASFAILAPNIGYEETKELAKKLHSEFEILHDKGRIDSIASVHIGIAIYDGEQNDTELLSMADMALRAAQIKGPNHWHIYDEQNISKEHVRSASTWRKIIKNAIDEKSILLHYQPVTSLTNGNILHYEVLARLQDKSGQVLNASTFLPMAQRYDLATGIDLVVIEKLFDLMGDENQVQYAVNLSCTSILDEEFITWLKTKLQQYPHRAKSIIFEMREYSVANHIQQIRGIIAQLREMGCAFSLDHFGAASPDFGYLLTTKIDYIKIDGGYINNIEGNDDNRFFLKSIVEIAHGLDIQVIGEYVETEKEWRTIKKLNLDGAQGHFIGKPEADLAHEVFYSESINQ